MSWRGVDLKIKIWESLSAMAYSQSYVDALAERLIPFTEQDLAEAKALGQRERGFFTVPESRTTDGNK